MTKHFFSSIRLSRCVAKKNFMSKGGSLRIHTDVEFGQRPGGKLTKVRVRRGPRQFKAAIAAMGGAAAHEQIVDFHEIKFMAALLGFEHQDEGGVLVDVDFFDGIHHHPDYAIDS